VTTPPDEYKVGYGRPPLQTRWKKGENGNHPKKRKRPESVVEMIDSLLLKQVKLSLNGETKRVPALEAIISQLQVKEMSGNRRATRILLKYKEFANQHADRRLEVIFVNEGDGAPTENDNG
jgi:Family of unknown function (DUF5681)